MRLKAVCCYSLLVSIFVVVAKKFLFFLSFPVFSSFLSHRCLTARPPGFMKMSVPSPSNPLPLPPPPLLLSWLKLGCSLFGLWTCTMPWLTHARFLYKKGRFIYNKGMFCKWVDWLVDLFCFSQRARTRSRPMRNVRPLLFACFSFVRKVKHIIRCNGKLRPCGGFFSQKAANTMLNVLCCWRFCFFFDGGWWGRPWKTQGN